jgi:acetyl-CoA carboxylase biotin carboxyl carrier protein
MDAEELRRLLEVLVSADVREFHLKTEAFDLQLLRGASGEPSAPLTSPLPPQERLPPGEPGASQEPSAQPGLVPVHAPIVGTFYTAPAPDQPPFVTVGERVKEGQVLCIIEAMKLMNEIEAEQAGVIREILAKNGDPVEFGQELFLIET